VNPRAIIILVVLVPVYRDPPSSTFPSAPVIDTTGESVDEQAPAAASNVVPFRRVAA
jgi:hypothetical protein